MIYIFVRGENVDRIERVTLIYKIRSVYDLLGARFIIAFSQHVPTCPYSHVIDGVASPFLVAANMNSIENLNHSSRLICVFMIHIECTQNGVCQLRENNMSAMANRFVLTQPEIH